MIRYHTLSNLSFRGSQRAFSLTELLVVIAIMSLLLSVSFTSFNSMTESNNLTMAASILNDQFSMARQVASVQNRRVEVRLIKLPPIPASAANNGYRAVQIWISDSTGTMTASGRLIALPQNVIITENIVLSKLLAASNLNSGTLSDKAGTAKNSKYVAIGIRPSGQIEPIPSTSTEKASLYLTLLNSRDYSVSTPPRNYATIQLNPDIGTTQVFRP